MVAAEAAAALAESAGGLEVDAGDHSVRHIHDAGADAGADASDDADGWGTRKGSVAKPSEACIRIVELREPVRCCCDFRGPQQCCGPSNGCGGVRRIDCGGFRAHTSVHSCMRLCAPAVKLTNRLLAEDVLSPSSTGADLGASLSASAPARRKRASWSPICAASQIA